MGCHPEMELPHGMRILVNGGHQADQDHYEEGKASHPAVLPGPHMDDVLFFPYIRVPNSE